jgi:hypothetical protein
MLEIRIGRNVIKVYFRSANDEAAIKSQLNVDPSSTNGILEVSVERGKHDWGARPDMGVWWRVTEKRAEPIALPDRAPLFTQRTHYVIKVIPPSVIQLLEVDTS